MSQTVRIDLGKINTLFKTYGTLVPGVGKVFFSETTSQKIETALDLFTYFKETYPNGYALVNGYYSATGTIQGMQVLEYTETQATIKIAVFDGTTIQDIENTALFDNVVFSCNADKYTVTEE